MVSLGAFEHFCSPEDYTAGRQEDIYRDLFARAAALVSLSDATPDLELS